MMELLLEDRSKRPADLAQLALARRYPHQAAMCHLQQARRQCFPSTLLRAGHLRNMYVPGTISIRLIRSRMLIILGQSNLPPSCPVCEHSPLSAEDCLPNKSLRTTIRVFLRTAEKKREASRPKESHVSAPPTPVEATNPPSASSSAVDPPALRDTTPRDESVPKPEPVVKDVTRNGEPSQAQGQEYEQVRLDRCHLVIEFY